MTELEYFKQDDLAASTWRKKYALEDEANPDDMHKRLAKEFFRIEDRYNNIYTNDNIRENLSEYGKLRKPLTELDIYNYFKEFKYIIPGGSVLSGCGSNTLTSLSNCFVIDSPKDSYSDIMKTRNYQVQLMKRRGGVGYDLSQLRPRGAKVNNAAQVSTGAASFMDVNSGLTNETAQDGRRGALMLSLSIKHPDIEEFITKKQDLTKVTGANISVKVTDDFMRAVENNEYYILRFPITAEVHKDIDIEDLEEGLLWEFHEKDKPTVYYKKVRAADIWNKLMHCAWNTAEPGILFEDTIVNYSPDGAYNTFRMVSTNPCGEIPMGGFDSCRLIHINLTSFIKDPFTEHSKIDYTSLYEVSYEAMRLADDLVDLEVEAITNIIKATKDNDNIEANLWLRILENTRKGRRTGLGFTGLADAVAMLNMKYCSHGSLETIEEIMSTIFAGQLDSTIDMALVRGVFDEYDYLTELNNNNAWYKWVNKAYHTSSKRMQAFGRRNISFSTVAPTGTISILAQVSSGIEPVFMPYYQRKRKCMSSEDKVDYVDKVGEKYTLFTVVHPNLKKWVIQSGYNIPSMIENIEEYIENEYTLEHWEEAFKASPYYGATATEVNWRDRVELQGVIQKYITHSISSTVNLHKDTTKEEVANIYLEAWAKGLKGITIYRDGCREGVLTKMSNINDSNRQAPKRPKELEADYYQVKVKGEQFIVLVGLLDNKPYEVFTFRPLHPVNITSHKGKLIKIKKMQYSFVSDYIEISDIQLANTNIEEKAATLYTSSLLRHGVNIEFIVKTAKKVNDNITSFSSAMCRILSKYIISKEVKGEVCPDCGSNLTRSGGCISCTNCSYSRCN